jgi:uncharacterized protein DUF4382
MNFHRRLPALLVVVTALALVAGCTHSNDSQSRQGDVRIVLSGAAPATTTTTAAMTSSTKFGTTYTSDTMSGGDWGDGGILSKLTHVNVTFSSFLARNLDGDLIDLTIDLPMTVDLITILNGQQITFPTGTLPPGMYDQLVVVITHVELDFVDGGKFDLTPPGGGWTKIIPVTPFQVVEGQTITIDLEFNPLNAFHEDGGEFEFSPEFECDRD